MYGTLRFLADHFLERGEEALKVKKTVSIAKSRRISKQKMHFQWSNFLFLLQEKYQHEQYWNSIVL